MAKPGVERCPLTLCQAIKKDQRNPKFCLRDYHREMAQNPTDARATDYLDCPKNKRKPLEKNYKIVEQ